MINPDDHQITGHYTPSKIAITTSDSYMTIEEDNQKAKSITDTSKSAPAVGVSLTPVNKPLPVVAPLSAATTEDEALAFTPVQALENKLKAAESM